LRIVELGQITLIGAAMPADDSSDTSLVPAAGSLPLEAQEYLFYLLFQAARQRDAYCDRELEPTGLNMAQWRVLAIVRRIEGCTMSLLARYSTIDRTTLTRAVDQLVGRGLVERWTPERDRRQVNLALTAEGEAAFAQAAELLAKRNAAVLANVCATDLHGATEVLQTAITNFVTDPALAHDLITFGRRPRSEES
jgi:DNA-binding MarR family transcriptional regulator